ncbi:MAG: type IX secretion system membrane protein PorP/SprF [Flavobacteriales bacterium]|nr:type IX secretion system membrane protein PorP/SprF [Flavobacteriales bacterium]
MLLRSYIALVTFFFALSIHGQQIVMNSQYMFNDFAINPAVAGTKNYAPITIDLRRQWVGIREAPAAQHLSYHGHVHKQIGAGGYLFNDVAGPVRRTGLMAALSTQVATSYGTRLSFGMAGSFTQFVMDKSRIFTEEPNDITVDQYTTNELIPDLSVGMHWYGSYHHVGVSIHNLLQSKTDLYAVSLPVTSTLDRAIYITGSYLIGSSTSVIALEPSCMLRMMFNAPLTFDLNARIIYNHQMWAGLSYRYLDAIALLLGIERGFFGIGYSYDMNTSALSNYNGGSHEVVLIFKTNKRKSGSGQQWNQRNRVYDCPAFK